MDELSIEDLNTLIAFYRQKASDQEWQNLSLQLKLNKALASNSQVSKKTKSD
jgi:hypothetical protein